MEIYNYLDALKAYDLKTAISDKNGSFTYKELFDFSKIIAANLQEKGIKATDRVVINLDRTKEHVAAFIGCLLCGAVAVPFNFYYPDDRKTFIAKDADSKFEINDEFLKSLNKALIFKKVEINESDESFLLYTSGSTGNPKGVIHTHQTLFNAACGEASYLSSISEDKNQSYNFGLVAQFSFVATWFFVFSNLQYGNAIYIVPNDAVKDINAMCEYFANCKIDLAYLPLRTVNYVLAKYKGFKYVYVGSERISNISSDTTKFINIYGSSELFPGITHFLFNKAYENTPLGDFVDFVKGYILDEEGNEVDEGELCISGNLFKGYNKLEEQTNKVLVANPFKERDGYPTLYRTGDLCRRESDGSLMMLNRKDWMIKINGQRIEPLEIETVLKGVDGIKEAAIKDFVGPNKQPFIVGYFVAVNDIDENTIKEELKKKLPDYMIPSFIMKLDAIPTNANGKLDRKALPMPSLDKSRDYVAPIGELETKLANAFSQILKLEKVGRGDDFFYLGGDSMKAMELQYLLKDEDISTKAIYEGRTIEQIALLISDAKKIDYVHVEKEYYKLSSSQLGVYLDLLKEPDSLKYNNPFFIKLGNEVDINKLTDAIKAAINNHDSFKCVIEDHDGFPSMVKKEFTFDIPYINETKDEAVQKLVYPFNLKAGPLYRFNYIKDGNATYLFMDFHHTVFDGTTMKILLREIKDAYEGKSIDKEQVSIFDIENYERAVSQSEEYKKAEEFYDGEFAGLECQNSIQIDYDSDKNEAGEINETTTGKIDFTAIANYLKNNGIAENTLFLGVYLYTLSIFNGDGKAFACAGENGRHSAKLESTGGMFVQNIPVFFDFTNYQSVKQFLFDLENKFRLYVNNDIFSFSKIATKYGLSNDFSFVYQGDSFNTLSLGSNQFEINKIKVDDAISNLQLMAFKKGGSFEFNFTYRKDLYNQSVIQSIADSYVHFLSEFIVKDDFIDFSLISSSSLAMLEKLNDKDYEFERSDFVTLFKKNLNQYPNNVAVCYIDKKYTYTEANQIANKIANYILSLNLSKKGVGGILIPRNEYMILASLGVLKAGFGMQPLDSSYPQDRLNFMLADSGAEILITTKELRPLVNEYQGNVLYIEDIPSLTNDLEPVVEISHSDIFVMLYTSGTTGKPKGVILEHKNWVNLFKNTTMSFDVDSDSRIACYASYGFDASVMDLFTPLSVGAASYIVPEDIRLDLTVLDKFYCDNQITHGVITTQVGRKFYDKSESKFIKSLMVGGEKLVPIYHDDTFKLINGYGPTETTAYITSQPVDKLYKRVPIGKVNINNKAYVVDKNFRLLPFGAPGELVIAGEQVSRGYHNREDVTKKVFVTNPFSDDPKYKRMYRTGDVVRLLSDGCFDFVGRNDAQVKIRGFRVELSEVEKTIREFKKVKDVAVVDFDKPSGGKFIAAYIVSDEEISKEELKEHILKTKPSYMVPEVVMRIEKIPLNQNQKLNKKALPAPTFTSNKDKKESVQSDSYIVSILRKFIKDITGNDSASYEDDLFEYGITSISLMELLSNISKEFSVSLNIKDLLEGCSFKNLEKLIVLALMNNSKSETIVTKEIKEEYLLSETQNGLYVEYLKDRKSLNYNMPFYRYFDKQKFPTLNVDALKEVVNKVFNAHPSLKCTIKTNKDNQIVMVPHNDDEVVINVIKGNEKDLENLKNNFVKPFDLEKSVYNVSIFEGDGLYLFVDFHHIMFDGSSLSIFMNDLDEALKGNEIESETYSVFDVAVDEKEKIQTDGLSKSKDYYDILFGDLDGSTPIIEECFIVDSKKEELDISNDIIDVQSLDKLIKSKGLSYNAFFVGAFGLFLNKYTYNDISCFATIYNGRRDLKEANTIGMLVKTLPFVTNTKNNPSVDDYLASCKKQILDNMANDIYSFANVAKDHNVNTDLMFIYQGAYVENDINPLPIKDVKSPLSIEVRNDDKKVYFHVEFDGGKYSPKFIERLVKSYEIMCKSLINCQKVNDVTLVDEDDKQEIFKAVTNNFAFDQTPVISRIENTIKQYKNKTAVVYEDKSLTYEELGTLSQNIAGYISSLDIKNEDVVAIMVPRSIYMVLCSVAALRAGAGYQPLDSSYPKDRLNFMIQDSGAKLLITTKELRPLVDEYKGPVLFVEDIEKLSVTEKLDVVHNIHDRFIMLYTSGTTGTPKGVILENINLSALVSAYSRAKKLDENNIASSYASFGFDACLLDFYPTLVLGGTIHIISEELRLNFPKLIQYIEDNKISTITATTQVGRQIALTCKSKYLKRIGMGGEKLVPFDPKDVPFEVYNQYGPSECTSYSN